MPQLEEPEVFVDNINRVIDQILEPYSETKIRQDFNAIGDDLSGAQVIFLGEKHTHISTLIDQVRALEFLVSPNSVILIEGHDAGQSTDCTLEILGIYTAILWERAGLPYDPTRLDKFTAEHALTWLLAKSNGYLNLAKLKLYNSQCVYWDDSTALDLNDDAPRSETLSQRNKAMVSEIKKHIKEGKRVFVLAGSKHLPSQDLRSFKSNYMDFPLIYRPIYRLSDETIAQLSVPKYYALLENFLKQNHEAGGLWEKLQRLRWGAPDRTPAEDIAYWGHGSTKVIHEFFKRENVKYIELIPKALVETSV